MPSQDLDSVDPLHQFVLLGVIDLRHREDTPVHSFDVTKVCADLLDEHGALEELLPGGITRQRAIRALSELEEADLLGKETKKSATGKGRPAYSLAIDEVAILDELAADERFADAVATVRQRRES